MIIIWLHATPHVTLLSPFKRKKRKKVPKKEKKEILYL